MQIKTFINYIKNIKTNEKIARAKRLKTLAFKQIYLYQEKIILKNFVLFA